MLERNMLLALRPPVLVLRRFCRRIMACGCMAVDVSLFARLRISCCTFVIFCGLFSPSNPRCRFSLSTALVSSRSFSLVVEGICIIAKSICVLAANGLSVVQEWQERLRRGESFYPGDGIVSKGRSRWHFQMGLVMKAVARYPLCVFESNDLEHPHGLHSLHIKMADGVSPESRNTITVRSVEQSRAARTINA
jgi:hypothetical protein